MGYLRLGKTPDGRECGKIVNFTKHQRVDKPQDSQIEPLITFVESSQKVLGLFQDHSCLDRKGKEGIGKDHAEPPTPRKEDLAFNALCLIEGSDPHKIGAQGSRIGKCLKSIRSSTPDVTPDEIRRRAGNYAKHFKDATISADALAKWWTRCDNGALPGFGEEIKPAANLR